jgi:hypothetical protein
VTDEESIGPLAGVGPAGVSLCTLCVHSELIVDFLTRVITDPCVVSLVYMVACGIDLLLQPKLLIDRYQVCYQSD